jgi:hypothetical protein
MAIVPRSPDKSNTPDFASIERALAEGFTFGPRGICACCQSVNGDEEAVGRGICASCWETLEIRAQLERDV